MSAIGIVVSRECVTNCRLRHECKRAWLPRGRNGEIREMNEGKFTATREQTGELYGICRYASAPKKHGVSCQSSLCDDWGRVSDRRSDRSSSSSSSSSRCSVAVDLGLRTLPGNVTSLAAAVAGLSSSVQWTAIWCGAVAGDVAKLAAGVAFHGLSLAVTGKVVWSAALVAGSRTSTTSETATEPSVSTTRSGCTASSTSAGVGAGTLFTVSTCSSGTDNQDIHTARCPTWPQE